MPDPVLMAKAFAFAAALAMAITLLFTMFSSSRPGVAAAGAPLAILAAVYAGLWVLGLLPHFPPREALDRLLVIVLPAAAGAEVIAARSRRLGWLA